jgi:hypothetical protein
MSGSRKVILPDLFLLSKCPHIGSGEATVCLIEWWALASQTSPSLTSTPNLIPRLRWQAQFIPSLPSGVQRPLVAATDPVTRLFEDC